MKLKLTVLFIALALALTYFVFKKDIMSYQSVTPQDAPMSGETITKQAVFNYFSSAALVDYQGVATSISSADLQSSDRVIVHLWASWCAPCVNEVPDLIQFATREVAKNSRKTIFIAVSLDEGAEELGKFLKSFPDFDAEPFRRVWDRGGGLAKLLNADRLPMTVMVFRDRAEVKVVRGVVDWKTVGD
ncbi:MAG: TlpA family protein disulfide reductase [Bdellovibrionaceae bacterium]|nr:TlpA family protein disulfide reductase [Bdellovibrio sp.]